jgi:hypothetical protein
LLYLFWAFCFSLWATSSRCTRLNTDIVEICAKTLRVRLVEIALMVAPILLPDQQTVENKVVFSRIV